MCGLCLIHQCGAVLLHAYGWTGFHASFQQWGARTAASIWLGGVSVCAGMCIKLQAMCALACMKSFLVQQMLTKCAAKTAHTQPCNCRSGCHAKLRDWSSLLVGKRALLFVEKSNLCVCCTRRCACFDVIATHGLCVCVFVWPKQMHGAVLLQHITCCWEHNIYCRCMYCEWPVVRRCMHTLRNLLTVVHSCWDPHGSVLWIAWRVRSWSGVSPLLCCTCCTISCMCNHRHVVVSPAAPTATSPTRSLCRYGCAFVVAPRLPVAPYTLGSALRTSCGCLAGTVCMLLNTTRGLCPWTR